MPQVRKHIFTKIKEILSKDETKQRLNSPSLDSVKREREIAYFSLLYLSHKLYGFIGDLNFEEGKPSFEGSEKKNKKVDTFLKNFIIFFQKISTISLFTVCVFFLF